MGRREELERQIQIAQDRIDNAGENIPTDVLSSWNKELDSLSFELNNLYDDYETETE